MIGNLSVIGYCRFIRARGKHKNNWFDEWDLFTPDRMHYHTAMAAVSNPTPAPLLVSPGRLLSARGLGRFL